MEALIEVRIAHPILRHTVEEQARAYMRPAVDLAHSLRVVLCTTGDVTPSQAAKMVADGKAVVVLATMPGAAEQRAYVAAGAEYVPMSPGESRWTDNLEQTLRAHRAARC